MMQVMVTLNGDPIAGAKALNTSELADWDNYSVIATEGAFPDAGRAAWSGEFEIRDHARSAGPWPLVARIAAAAGSRGEYVGFQAPDPFGARAGDALVYLRNPGDGRADQLVISYRNKATWSELTADQMVRLAEDLLTRARTMRSEGRGA